MGKAVAVENIALFLRVACLHNSEYFSFVDVDKRVEFIYSLLKERCMEFLVKQTQELIEKVLTEDLFAEFLKWKETKRSSLKLSSRNSNSVLRSHDNKNV
jgi:hypothetical protein